MAAVVTMPVLRPLGFGEILDAAFSLFGRHWRTLVASALAVALPVYLLSTSVLYAVAPEQFDLGSNENPLNRLTEPGQGDVLAVVLAARLVELGGSALALLACLLVAGRAYAGGAAPVRAALAVALRRLPHAVGLSLMIGVGVGLGLVALVVPGVWLGTVWALAFPALLFERRGVIGALGRSRALVRGRFWTVLGVLALVFVLVLVVSTLVGALAGGIAAAAGGDGEAAGALVALVAGIGGIVVTVPVLACVLAVLYVDQRLRAGGFELDQLVRALDGGEVDAAPAPGGPAPAAPGLDRSPGPEPERELPGGWRPPSPHR